MARKEAALGPHIPLALHTMDKLNFNNWLLNPQTIKMLLFNSKSVGHTYYSIENKNLLWSEFVPTLFPHLLDRKVWELRSDHP